MAHPTATTTEASGDELLTDEQLREMSVARLTTLLGNCAASFENAPHSVRLNSRRNAGRLAKELVRRGEEPRARDVLEGE